jgi:arylsulfatase A-like enzyme
MISSKPKKPNLLFIWTDEQRADTMAAYGNKKIHAHNLNKLAGESVVFQNAYVSQPVCTPSRSTVMTPEEIYRASQENSRAVISPDGWKLCLSDGDKHQLYNLNEDPGETRNLYYSSQYKEIINKLSLKIYRWQKKVNDTLNV